LHLALEGSTPEVRQGTMTAVAESTLGLPHLTSSVIRDAVNTFLSRSPPASKAASSSEEHAKPWNKHLRLSALLLSSVSFDADLDLAVREDMVVELIIIGHHHLTCTLFLSLPCFTLPFPFDRWTLASDVDRFMSKSTD
jgi:Generalcontrol nonderepressible 1 (Gcn1) N-terminal